MSCVTRHSVSECDSLVLCTCNISYKSRYGLRLCCTLCVSRMPYKTSTMQATLQCDSPVLCTYNIHYKAVATGSCIVHYNSYPIQETSTIQATHTVIHLSTGQGTCPIRVYFGCVCVVHDNSHIPYNRPQQCKHDYTVIRLSSAHTTSTIKQSLRAPVLYTMTLSYTIQDRGLYIYVIYRIRQETNQPIL